MRDTPARFPAKVVLVLAADRFALRQLHGRARADGDRVRVVAFTEVARRARDYDTYLADLRATATSDVSYVGLQISGPRNWVTALTKRLPLFGG